MGCIISGCKTIEIAPFNHNVLIGDLRDVPRIGGKQTSHERLIIFTIDEKQTVFEVTDTNSLALSNIPTNYIDKLSVIMNDTGNFDTKYDIIISLTLKKKALEILNDELKLKIEQKTTTNKVR